MKQALGLIEIKGLATTILVADTMAKTANVKIEQIENTKGFGWMTIKIVGDVGAVNAAVKAGELVGSANQFFISSKVIPRPSDSVEAVFCQSTKKEEINKNIDKNNTNENVIEEVNKDNIKEEIEEVNQIDIEDIKIIENSEKEIVEINNEQAELNTEQTQENKVIEENDSSELKENNEQFNSKKQKSKGRRKKENTENTDKE